MMLNCRKFRRIGKYIDGNKYIEILNIVNCKSNRIIDYLCTDNHQTCYNHLPLMKRFKHFKNFDWLIRNFLNCFKHIFTAGLQ